MCPAVHFPGFQAFFRKHQPPAWIVWGKNGFIFPAEGAAPYTRGLENLETHGDEIGNRIEGFLLKKLKR